MPQNTQPAKTRDAVIEAFNDLVLRERYPDIRVSDLVRESDVARSTFYEHFRDKDDVLRQSMAGILAVLASAVEAAPDLRRLQSILEHFDEQRPMARAFFNSPTIKIVTGELASLIEPRLPELLPLPTAMIAQQIAEAEVGLIRAWLTKEMPVTAIELAEGLHRSIRGIVNGYATAG